jgi:diketogulonate reductase-like aldo/keto reductase
MRECVLLGVVSLFFVPIQPVSSLSLVDRRKVLNTATTTILSSSWLTPANAERLDPLYTNESRQPITIPTSYNDQLSTISIPKIGYSLYNTNPNQAEACVQLAIQAGYRHFDVATQYGSNEQVGRVIRTFVNEGLNAPQGTNKRQRRQQLFLSHKVSNEEQSTKIVNVKQAVKRQLHHLSVAYLDLCYIHSPLTDPDRRLTTYQALLELQQEGIIKAIGVCNYGIHPLSKYE